MAITISKSGKFLSDHTEKGLEPLGIPQPLSRPPGRSSVTNSPVRSADRKPMSPPVSIQKLRRQLSAAASSMLQAASINSGPLPSPFKIPTAKGRKSGLGSICWPFTLTRLIANAIWTRLRHLKSKGAYNRYRSPPFSRRGDSEAS